MLGLGAIIIFLSATLLGCVGGALYYAYLNKHLSITTKAGWGLYAAFGGVGGLLLLLVVVSVFDNRLDPIYLIFEPEVGQTSLSKDFEEEPLKGSTNEPRLGPLLNAILWFFATTLLGGYLGIKLVPMFSEQVLDRLKHLEEETEKQKEKITDFNQKSDDLDMQMKSVSERANKIDSHLGGLEEKAKEVDARLTNRAKETDDQFKAIKNEYYSELKLLIGIEKENRRFYQEAIMEFEDALKVKSGQVAPHFHIGYCYMYLADNIENDDKRRAKYKESLEEFKIALKLMEEGITTAQNTKVGIHYNSACLTYLIYAGQSGNLDDDKVTDLIYHLTQAIELDNENLTIGSLLYDVGVNDRHPQLSKANENSEVPRDLEELYRTNQQFQKFIDKHKES